MLPQRLRAHQAIAMPVRIMWSLPIVLVDISFTKLRVSNPGTCIAAQDQNSHYDEVIDKVETYITSMVDGIKEYSKSSK